VAGRPLSNTGIRLRVLLLTLVPLLVFSLVLGQYTVMSRIDDLEAALRERGDTLARYLAAESEFGLFSEDRAQLDRLAASLLDEQDVHAVTIMDADRRVITRVLRDHWMMRPAGAVDDGMLASYTAPVHRSSISVAEHAELFSGADGPRHAAPEMPIGWVEVSLSRESTLARQQSIIRNIVMIATATALFSMMIALWMGRGIVRPIIRLSQAVDDMHKGRLDTRVTPSTGGEIGALERGFNDMAEVMEQARNRLQSEIEEATGKLQSTIRELEQKNRELDNAREKALAAGDEKANFLANMSHEIRTPINAILGFTSLLEKSGLSADQYEYARTISCASTQLLRVIDDILSFSRLESGTVQLDRTEFDLRDVLEDVLCMLGPEAREKELELVLLIDSDVPLKLIGDAVRFRQVVINLMNNAIKFTERGGVNVEVRLVAMEDNRIEIELRVIDTGIGIPREVVDRIFSSFHQADATISRRYGGTGLGLAIVSRLVALWGGRIGVSSEPDAGSTFWFTFRCELQDSQDDHAAAPALAGRKILLYDDNPVACRAVRNLLLTWSINVFHARRRRRIEQMLHDAREMAEPFELVMFGLGADRQTGSDDGDAEALVDLIRREYRIPVLLMANCTRNTLLGRSLSDPGLKCVIKPLRRDILHRSLCALLGVDPGATEAGVTTGADVKSAADTGEFHGLRVLLAEDNEFNRLLVTRVLEQAGVEVTDVDSGDKALAHARANDFDLVIMDLHLPGMDGPETARNLRRVRPTLRHIPIIALTADVYFNDPEKMHQSEIDACLLKPLEEAKLWELIRTLCVSPAADGRKPPAERPRTVDEIRARLWPRLAASIRDQQQLIANATTEGDRNTLAGLIHELKGISGYFGVGDLVARIEEVEQLIGRNADDREVRQAANRLGDAIDRVLEAVTATIESE
jgi:two-component system, NarL family, sensor histidine kinase BarA